MPKVTWPVSEESGDEHRLNTGSRTPSASPFYVFRMGQEPRSPPIRGIEVRAQLVHPTPRSLSRGREVPLSP